MKLWIPTIGDIIILTKDWKFDLWIERRNAKLIKSLLGETKQTSCLIEFDREFVLKYREKLVKQSDNPYTPRYTLPISLPKNTELKIDRVYIRKNASDYNSISFRIENSPLREARKQRFWAKLPQVNEIYYRKTD